jgi:ATP-dependent Lhr-like helicase
VAAERRAWFEPQPPASEAALVEILRGRLEALGPVRAAELAAPLGVPAARADAALAQLQAEGFAMRGEFTSGSATGPGSAIGPGSAAGPESAPEWCERRLLARIHRYTVKRLRAEIEPVPARDFLRFLFVWQRVQAGTRLQGADAVAAVLTQLEGFEAPAAAWETEILPTRVAGYEPEWLDDQGRAGRSVWTRLAERGGDPDRGAAPVRSTPIVLLARRQVAHWSSLTRTLEPGHLSSRARAVVDTLAAQGASFFEEIAEQTRLLPAEAEAALGELVAVGLVNSDSFAGLRALLVPAEQRAHSGAGSRRKRRRSLLQMADAGRWALVRKPLTSSPSSREAAVEAVVRSLLRRWGVIFWRLLAREADWLPPWRELLQCCRRLEARGELRGGRFVAGFSGEQFALPEAIGALREVRRSREPDGALESNGTHERSGSRAPGEFVAVSAADPLNLIGILTPGPRLASLTSNRVLFREGLPVATLTAGEVHFLVAVAPADEWELRTHLVQRHVPAALAEMVFPLS